MLDNRPAFSKIGAKTETVKQQKKKREKNE